MIKVADYVARFVHGLGVRDIFLLPGGGSMHLVDAVGRQKGLRFVCNLHEQACAIAAEAYAQYKDGFGCSLVTTGPGGTNAMTGLAAAWVDSTPVFFVSGQVKRPDIAKGTGVRMLGFQEVDTVSLVKPLTKYAVTVTDPLKIRYHLEKAAYLARTGRQGPVWIDVPLDVQATKVSERALKGFTPPKSKKSSSVDAKAERTVRMLEAAERPVLLAGHGIRHAGALPEFKELLKHLKIPILTTWRALDFLPEDHHLYAGRPGGTAQRGANLTQQNSDLLITIGARLDFGQTAYNHPNFARAAKKVMVDIDPTEIGKMKTKIDLPVAADAGNFLRALLKRKKRLAKISRKAWLKKSLDWKAKYPVVLPEHRTQKKKVNDYYLLEVLSEQMQSGDLLVPGSSGACSERTMQSFCSKRGVRVLNSNGLGAMGFGISAAIGACVASGGKRTVTIDGDGGAQLNIQELETIRRLKLPVKLFILNNAGYASIRISQKAYFKGRFVASDDSSGLTLPDIGAVAKAYGLPSVKISSHKELRSKIRRILSSKGPVVVDVVGSKEMVTAPRVTSYQKPDGTMVSRPMEDVWPLLPREEFEAEMIIDPVRED